MLLELGIEATHELAEGHPIGAVLREKVLMECTLLGLVSFCAFMFLHSGAYDEITWFAEREFVFLLFEYAHVLLFMTALCHVSFIGVLAMIMRDVEKYWDRLNATPVDKLIKDLEKLNTEWNGRENVNSLA